MTAIRRTYLKAMLGYYRLLAFFRKNLTLNQYIKEAKTIKEMCN